MKDRVARWFAKVARSVGRLDFDVFYTEMTPYEIAVQQALWSIEPWGDDRDDLRHAVNTMVQGGSDKEDALNSLQNYLPVKQKDSEIEVSPDEAARMFRA